MKFYSNRAIREIFEARNVEVRHPKPGFRHQAGVRLVYHRFPVRGGLNHYDLMERLNPLKIFGIKD